MVIVGITNHPDDERVDAELVANAKKFTGTVEQAGELSSREINVEVDYAVITEGGEILAAWGGVPLHLDSPVGSYFKADSTTSMRLGTADYLVYSKSITDPAGKAVAAILVPKDATLELRGIREQDIFNLLVIGAACVMAILMTGALLRRTLSKTCRHPALPDALKIGEGNMIEFKRSLDWDFGKNARDPKPQLAVLKSIAGFLNSQGGMLLIGVRDNGSVEGIEADLRHFNGSRDKFSLHFRGILTEKIGLEFARYIKDRSEDVEGKTVWVVEVDSGPMEAFVKWENSARFFIREGPRSLDLNPKETVQYIRAKDWSG